MNILEGTQYIITLPTDSDELATLLDNYANDWTIVLDFIDTVATKRGVTLDVREVSRIMKRKYGEE